MRERLVPDLRCSSRKSRNGRGEGRASFGVRRPLESSKASLVVWTIHTTLATTVCQNTKLNTGMRNSVR